MMMFSFTANRRRSGSVLVLTALSVVVLLGCVALSVDYGMLVMDANRLQRGCDAAALAAATKLKHNSAVSSGDAQTDAANALADRNAASIDAYNVALKNDNVPVDTSQGDVTFSNNDAAVTVRSTTSRHFFFAPILGRTSGNVTRSATAIVRPITAMSTSGSAIRVAPIGITWDTYNAYKNDQATSHDISLVRQNKSVFGKDDMVLFDLRSNNGKSGAQMQSQLAGDTNVTSTVGDYETTLNADTTAQIQKLTGGLDTLFSRAAGAPWYDTASDNINAAQILSGSEPSSNPRVVYIIVTPSTTSPNNGTFNTQVQGFVPVYLDSYSGGNNGNGNGNGNANVSVRMRFLPISSVSDSKATTTPGTTTYYAGINSISLTG